MLETINRVRRNYHGRFGRYPNLLRPRRFSEKIQWRKLFDRNSLYTILLDKLAVRDFLAERIASEHIIPLVWTGAPQDIPFKDLPYPCVLKSNHACGHVQMLMAYDEQRHHEIVQAATNWLLVDYGLVSDEPGYSAVRPTLMIEQLLTDSTGAAPNERRFFVFNGIVRCVNTVFYEDGAMRNGAFHRPDWTRLAWFFSRWVERDFPRPQRLNDMILVAERLGQKLDHVRVDIFDCGERFYVGETTLYSWSGLSPFNSDAFDLELGAEWHIRWPIVRGFLSVIQNANRKRPSTF